MTKSKQVGVHEAKTHLSELLRAVAGGQEIEILRGGEPVAKLVPYRVPAQRQLGFDTGLITIADDFDSALPVEVETSFYE